METLIQMQGWERLSFPHTNPVLGLHLENAYEQFRTLPILSSIRLRGMKIDIFNNVGNDGSTIFKVVVGGPSGHILNMNWFIGDCIWWTMDFLCSLWEVRLALSLPPSFRILQHIKRFKITLYFYCKIHIFIWWKI